MSEKENGTMQLGAILNDQEDNAADIQQLASVAMVPLDAEALYQMSCNLHEYDLAFAKAIYRTDEEYKAEIPQTIHPVSISWKDDRKRPQCLVLAMSSSKERTLWLRAIR